MILVQQALFSIAEPALNKALAHDHSAAYKLGSLEAKSLSVELTDINFSVNLSVNNGKLRLSSETSIRDCFVKTELSHIKKLSDATQITSLIKQDLLELEGELSVAQKFSALFIDNGIDWQEWCSSYLGDGLTHKLFSSGKKAVDTLKRKQVDLDYTLQTALTEELKVVPSSIEVELFSNQVDLVSARTEKLIASLNSIKEKM